MQFIPLKGKGGKALVELIELMLQYPVVTIAIIVVLLGVYVADSKFDLFGGKVEEVAEGAVKGDSESSEEGAEGGDE